MKILAQRPTHIYAVATAVLITKTFTVKYYDRRIETNTVSIIIITITHMKRDSDCNGNEKKTAVKNNRSEKVKNSIKHTRAHTHTHTQVTDTMSYVLISK